MRHQKIKRYDFNVAPDASGMKKAVKVLIVLCLIAAVIFAAASTLGNKKAGWQGTGLHRYYISATTGQRIKGLHKIDGKLYYFGDNYFVKTSWVRENGYVGYADENGVLCQGESKIDGKYYYFQPGTGQLYTGWLTLDGVEYCFDETGHPRTGEYNEDGILWNLDKDGRVIEQVNGWKRIDGVLRYYDITGAPAQGWIMVDGREYLFVDGISQAGWVETEDGVRYLDGNGDWMTGWCVIDGQPYAFDEDGQLRQGWDHSHGKYYYFSDGISQSGSHQEGRITYNLNGSGSVQPVSGSSSQEEDLSRDAEGDSSAESLLTQSAQTGTLTNGTTTQGSAESAPAQQQTAPEASQAGQAE